MLQQGRPLQGRGPPIGCASLDRAPLLSSSTRRAWLISALLSTGDAAGRRIVELSRECGEKCGNQRFHEIALSVSDRHRDPPPPQLLSNNRTYSADLDSLGRRYQCLFKPGFCGA